jgi:hypothetical protein
VSLNAGAIWQTYALGRWIFEGITGPCLRFGEECKAVVAYSDDDVIVNGSIPNADVGIDIVGPNAHVHLSPGVAVSGALGDVRFNGTIMTHADITANGPYVDLDGNRVSHG